MRKLIHVVVIAGAFVIGAAFAPQASAQTVDVAQLRPFSPAANYMSLPGYSRYRIFLETGRWVSLEEVVLAVESSGPPTASN